MFIDFSWKPSLADILVPQGPEYSLDPRHPLILIRTVTTLASLVCLILVLVKLGKANGAFHVLLGLISCGFYPFLWAWIAPEEMRTRKIAIVWTVCTVVAVSLSAVGAQPGPRPSRIPFSDTTLEPPAQRPN